MKNGEVIIGLNEVTRRFYDIPRSEPVIVNNGSCNILRKGLKELDGKGNKLMQVTVQQQVLLGSNETVYGSIETAPDYEAGRFLLSDPLSPQPLECRFEPALSSLVEPVVELSFQLGLPIEVSGTLYGKPSHKKTEPESIAYLVVRAIRSI